MASKARRDAQAAHFLAATHWITYFVHVHGRPPQPTRLKDHDALRDIVRVQAGGREDRALDLIERIIRAPLPSESLSARYLEFWEWDEAQNPKRYSPLPRSVRADIRRCIRGAA